MPTTVGLDSMTKIRRDIEMRRKLRVELMRRGVAEATAIAVVQSLGVCRELMNIIKNPDNNKNTRRDARFRLRNRVLGPLNDLVLSARGELYHNLNQNGAQNAIIVSIPDGLTIRLPW